MTHDDEKPDTAQQALGEALGMGFRLLRVVMLLLLAAYLGSGIFVVHQHEKAAVLVFGKVSGLGDERWKGPGIYWTWPKPIAEVVRITTERVQTLESQSFWLKTDALGGPSSQPPPATLAPDQTGYTLTGDANLLHSRWAVRYTIQNPEAVLFRYDQLTTHLQHELDRAIVKASGRFGIDYSLRTGVDTFRLAVENELRTRCEQQQFNLRIQGVDLLGVMPPQQVADAFNQVIESEQERSRQISSARGYAARQRNEAEGEAARTIAEGRTYQSRLISEVAADADYFEKVRVEYVKNPEVIRRTLLQEGLRRALSGVDQKYIVYQSANGKQELRLMLGPEQKSPLKKK